MEQTNIAASSTPAQTTSETLPNATEANKTQTESKTVSYEMYETLQNNFASLKNSIEADRRRARESSVDATKPITKEAKTVEDRLRAVEEREKAAADKAREFNIREAINSAGVPSDRAEYLVDHIERKHKAAIVDGSTYRMTHDDGSFRDTPLKEWISTFVQSPNGEVFRPSVQTPVGRGLRSSGAINNKQVRYQDIPQEERLKLSPAQAASIIKDQMGL